MSEERTTFIRFGLLERLEHIFLLLSFTMLALTGLPQKFAEWRVSLAFIRALGGIENVRSIHHLSAIVLIILSIFHVIYVAYKVFVLQRPLAMFPRIADVRHARQMMAYNFGLSKSRPAMGRYNFGEKIEYWAVVWGTLIMAITGYMLWNPILTTRILPGEFIPAAKAAHGAEAILAVLSILTWHVYHVHIKYFNKSMFTGRISYHEMEEEHAAELERILRGEEPPLPSPAVMRRRRALFIPLASVFSLVLLVGTYYFFTVELTAITTLPPAANSVPIVVKATPTAQLFISAMDYLAGREAQDIPHAISEGREHCLRCHSVGAILPFTELHAELELTNNSCLSCHKLAAPEHVLPTVEMINLPSWHTDILPVLQSKCTACHGPDKPPDLSSYAGIMTPGSNGPLIIPQDAEHSRILLVQSMPLEAHPTRLTPEELALLTAWIEAGAPNN